MTGDQADIFKRIKALLPRWFGDTTPVIDSLLQGLAWAGSLAYALIAYARLQTRILTATDGWLDMIAADVFGAALLRLTSQTDTSFRGRIIINLFRERATRGGIIRVLQDLTGRTPKVFELLRPIDTGCYGGPTIGYGLAGGYGSILLPFQALVVAYRATGSGIPLVAGYGISTGGYGQASRADYAALSMITGAVTDADIYSAVDNVRPAATTIWVRIDS